MSSGEKSQSLLARKAIDLQKLLADPHTGQEEFKTALIGLREARKNVQSDLLRAQVALNEVSINRQIAVEVYVGLLE